MELKIEYVGRESMDKSDRRSATVETHVMRGDTWNIQKSDTLIENDSAVFRVKSGDRVVVTFPPEENEAVYDAAQGAAVRRGAQEDNKEKADLPAGAIIPSAPKEVPPPTNTAPFGQPASLGQQHKPGQTISPEMQKAAQAKAEAEAHAKAAQQSGAGRPPGEKPPLPGSPVGSPPAGNEGTK